MPSGYTTGCTLVRAPLKPSLYSTLCSVARLSRSTLKNPSVASVIAIMLLPSGNGRVFTEALSVKPARDSSDHQG